MTSTNDIADLGTLCRALGFLAVAMRADNLKAEGGAVRAEKLAKLIEEFSRMSSDTSNSAPDHSTALITAPTHDTWSRDYQGGRSVIRHAHTDTVIEIRGSAATRTAENILHAVNDNSRKDVLIAEMALCLEACMQSRKPDWSTEQQSDVLVAGAKQTRTQR